MNPAGVKKLAYLSDISASETQLSGESEINAVTIMTKKAFISVKNGDIVFLFEDLKLFLLYCSKWKNQMQSFLGFDFLNAKKEALFLLLFKKCDCRADIFF